MTVSRPGVARHLLIATAAMAVLVRRPRVDRRPAPPSGARRVVFAVLAVALYVGGGWPDWCVLGRRDGKRELPRMDVPL